MYSFYHHFVGIQSCEKTNIHHYLTESQQLQLEQFFQDNIYPDEEQKALYARKLGISVARVKRWFIRKRNTLTLEARYGSMFKSLC